MFKTALLIFATILVAQSASATSCNADCTVRYSRVADTLRYPTYIANRDAPADFQAYCRNMGFSSWFTTSYPWERKDSAANVIIVCSEVVQNIVTATGWGSNEFEARQDVRKSCERNRPTLKYDDRFSLSVGDHVDLGSAITLGTITCN
jgi:hypothetical protein